MYALAKSVKMNIKLRVHKKHDWQVDLLVCASADDG
jgi:hypothetical protein